MAGCNLEPLTGKNRGNLAKAVERTCVKCGKLFRIKPCAVKRGRGKYCSRECQYKGGSIEKVCEVCGAKFMIRKSHDVNGAGRYCSIKCRSVGYVRNGTMRGENAPRYIDGLSQSPEYVRRASHNRRVQKMGNGGEYTLLEWQELCEKHGNKCLSCGRDDVMLTVDHVIPVVLGGTNDISNLQPLCKSCNSRKHAHVIDYRQAANI